MPPVRSVCGPQAKSGGTPVTTYARQVRSVIAALGLLVALALAPAAAHAQVKNSIVMGATNATSSNYAIAVAIAQAIKDSNSGTAVTVLETGATLDNFRRMARGEVDISLASSDLTFLAAEGVGPFEGRGMSDMTVLFAWGAQVLNLAVRADSGIARLEDLGGRKLNAGMRGSAAESLTRDALAMFGIQPDWAPGTLKDAVEGIQNRQVVGYSKYAALGVPDATLRELMVSTPMRILGFNPAQEKAILDRFKGIAFFTLPSNTVPGQAEVRAPGVVAIYTTLTAKMNDDTAFAIAKSVHEKRQYLIDAGGHLKDYDFRAGALEVERMGLKLHPGAKKFWSSTQ
jgi:TRAP transporter TAXI family solute receptor